MGGCGLCRTFLDTDRFTETKAHQLVLPRQLITVFG